MSIKILGERFHFLLLNGMTTLDSDLLPRKEDEIWTVLWICAIERTTDVTSMVAK